MAMGAGKQPLDLVLLDPPYETGAGSVAIDKLARLGWIGEATWVSLETAKQESVSIKGFVAEATRDVGKARIHILRREA